MARPGRARWLVATVVAVPLFGTWFMIWRASEPLREWGAEAISVIQVVAVLLVFLTGHQAKVRSRRNGGARSRDDHV